MKKLYLIACITSLAFANLNSADDDMETSVAPAEETAIAMPETKMSEPEIVITPASSTQAGAAMLNEITPAQSSEPTTSDIEKAAKEYYDIYNKWQVDRYSDPIIKKLKDEATATRNPVTAYRIIFTEIPLIRFKLEPKNLDDLQTKFKRLVAIETLGKENETIIDEFYKAIKRDKKRRDDITKAGFLRNEEYQSLQKEKEDIINQKIKDATLTRAEIKKYWSEISNPKSNSKFSKLSARQKEILNKLNSEINKRFPMRKITIETNKAARAFEKLPNSKIYFNKLDDLQKKYEKELPEESGK